MILDAIRQAQKMQRAALEQTYEGLCSVIEYHEVQDAKTKLSSEEEMPVVRDQPCRLSFEKLASVAQTDTAAAVSQGTKLFLAPEVTVRSGSKVIVTQNGETGEYSASGKPAVYPTHQEVVLELFRGWA